MVRERMRTFVEGLDEAIGGGVPQGYIVLISGSPGTMKSSLAYSILYNNAANNGSKCLYMTLEQNRASLVEQMEEMGMKDDGAYDKISIVDMASLRKNLSFIQAKGSWIALFKMHLKNLMKNDRFHMLVIDSLDVLETMAKFEDRRTELFYLFEWLKELDVTTFLVSESPLSSSENGKHRDEAYLADGIFLLTLYPVNDIEVQRRIRCVKMRSTKHETGYFVLVWDGTRFEIARAVSGVK